MRRSARQKSQTGSALVECALCLGLFWAPLLMGTWVVGFGLIRSVQVTQICRDAGHMYSQGTDFTLPGAQALLASLAPSAIQINPGGNAVVYLSKITFVDQNLCTAGGLGPDAVCPNLGNMVFTEWIPVGNTGLSLNGSAFRGAFGDPSALTDPATGKISPDNYLKNSNAQAKGFSNLITFTNSGQLAYVSEMFVLSADLEFFQSTSAPGQYARSIF